MRTHPLSMFRNALSPLAACLFVLGACGDEEVKDGQDTLSGDILISSETSTSHPPETTGGNHAPELERIGNRTVGVGKNLIITLSAKDADGDSLTYSVFGAMPPGARFDKEAARFEWTPEAAGRTVFLTFVASDGLEFDRETVQLDVTAGGETHPPVFEKVGDQVVKVGTPFALKLEATDPDGDKLTFGHEGELPAGATLDAATGAFAWTATADQVGTPVRVTFTASDGTESATLAVRFVVDDGGGTTAKPPVFGPLADATAKAGDAFALDLTATDPNGDQVTFQIVSGAPTGATLTGAHFAWTPAAGDVGRTTEVVFSASDGALTTVATLAINVVSGQTASCQNDAYEPNESLGAAKPLAAGTAHVTLCDTATVYDTDFYAVTIPPGQSITATLNFESLDADVDLVLHDATGAEVAASEGSTATEEIHYTPTAGAQAFVLEVKAYSWELLALDYTLEIAYGAVAVCTDDAFEQNDTPATAKLLSEVGDTTVQICAGDTDYWKLEVQCGQHIEVLLDSPVDLDLYLFDAPTVDGEPIASAATADLTEVLDLPRAPHGGTYLLEVSGYPPTTTEGSYDMVFEQSGGCTDDAFANATKATAKALGASPVTGGVVCCGEDWYALTLAANDQIVVTATPQGAGSAIGVTLFDTNGTTQLAAADQATTARTMNATAAHAGAFYVRVKGSTGSRYDLALTVTAGTATCTALSCPRGKVCDSSNGQCVGDYCDFDTDCPSAHVCRDTYCVNPCTSNAECRPEYACKTLTGGMFCGIEGERGTGTFCWEHADCAGNMACAFQSHGGYCATLGCNACLLGTKCAPDTSDGEVCAETCTSASDCRVSDGYTCTAEKTCLPQD